MSEACLGQCFAWSLLGGEMLMMRAGLQTLKGNLID